MLSLQAGEPSGSGQTKPVQPISPELTAAVIKGIPKPSAKRVTKVPKVALSELPDFNSDDDNDDNWSARIRESDLNALDGHRSHRNQESVNTPKMVYEEESNLYCFTAVVKEQKSKKASKTMSEEGN